METHTHSEEWKQTLVEFLKCPSGNRRWKHDMPTEGNGNRLAPMPHSHSEKTHTGRHIDTHTHTHTHTNPHSQRVTAISWLAWQRSINFLRISKTDRNLFDMYTLLICRHYTLKMSTQYFWYGHYIMAILPALTLFVQATIIIIQLDKRIPRESCRIPREIPRESKNTEGSPENPEESPENPEESPENL